MIDKGVYVRVRSDLRGNRNYGDTYCNPMMEASRGRVFMVTRKLYDGEFQLEGIDNWVWSKEMLVPEAPPDALDVSVKLRVNIFGVGAVGEIVTAKQHGGFVYLGKEYLPMQGILFADEAKIIKEDN